MQRLGLNLRRGNEAGPKKENNMHVFISKNHPCYKKFFGVRILSPMRIHGIHIHLFSIAVAVGPGPVGPGAEYNFRWIGWSF
jgi:hypothetical protein